MFRTLTVLVVPLLVLAAIACGGDDDNSRSTTFGDASATASNGAGSNSGAAAGTPSPSEATPPSSVGGGVGVIEANGKSYGVGEVRRCEPIFEGDDNLDLQALASEGVILFVVINTPLGSANQLLSHELSVQGSAFGAGGQIGAFSGIASSIQGGPWMSEEGSGLAGPPFRVDGGRINGSMTVADARGGSETLDVTFDLPIPADVIEC